MPDQQTEELRAAIAGDRAALSQLLTNCGREIRPGLTATIGAHWRSIIDADDVLQVTYLEAFLKIKDFKSGSLPGFVTWLRRIAANNLQDAIRELTCVKRPDPRRRACQPRTDDTTAELYELLDEDSLTPSRAAAGEERRRILELALEQLPRDYREVLQKYYLEGLNAESVAQAMGRSIGAVYMLRARAVDELRRILPTFSAMYGKSA